MSFVWPQLLWLLLMIPVIIAGYMFALRRKKRDAARFANLSIVREALGEGAGFRRHVPPVLMILALSVLIISLARPEASVTLPSDRATIILTLDISLSMQADDIEPDRITASKDAVMKFVEDQPANIKIGVVAFAGEAMLVQEPTVEREQVLASIERFRLMRGTNTGSAIVASLRTLFPEAHFDLGRYDFWSGRRGGAPLGEAPPEVESFSPVEPGSYMDAAIFLLSDGRSTTGPNPIEAARLAADRGVRIFTVGFGSRDGGVRRGMPIYYQLDEATLEQVADVTRGEYFYASSGTDLTTVYEGLTTQFAMERGLVEITSLVTAAAAILFLVSVFLSLLWFNRII